MSLTPEQTRYYRNTLDVCIQTIDVTNQTIQEEQLKFKNRMEELDEINKLQRLEYANACDKLGIPNDLDEQLLTPKV